MTDPLKLDQREALARAATQQMWTVEHDSCDCGDGFPCSHGSWPHAIHGIRNKHAEGIGGAYQDRYGFVVSELCEMSEEDAQHIAENDPPTVLATIEEVRRLRQENDKLRRSLAMCVRMLSLPPAESLTHDTRCVDYDPAGNTYESTPKEWWVQAQELVTALPAPPEERTWQPIETFVSDPDDDEESVLIATDAGGVGEAWQDGEGCWFWGSGDPTYPVLGRVTHFQPLPAPPAAP